MSEPIPIRDTTMKKIIVTSSTMPKLDPAAVAAALGAVPVPGATVAPAGPINQFAVRRELYRRLQSSSASVPVSAEQWKQLEELAAGLASDGFAPTAGQVANALLTEALAQVRTQANGQSLRDLAEKMKAADT